MKLEQDDTFQNFFNEIFLNPLPFDLPPSPPPTTPTKNNMDQDNTSTTQFYQGTASTSQTAKKSNMCNDASFLVTPTRSNKRSVSYNRPPNFSLPETAISATKSFKHPKKSVHFKTFVRVVPLSIPPASDMTAEEKQDIWYNQNDFEQFKWKSARDAGVQLFRFQDGNDDNDDETKQSNANGRYQYLLDGNFDDDALNHYKNDDDSKHESVGNAITAAQGTNFKGDAPSKVNEKEYDDDEAHQICKRGLGYHFSRIRRRHKLMFRLTVLEWQRKLREHSNKFNHYTTSSPSHISSCIRTDNATTESVSVEKLPSQSPLKNDPQKNRYPPLDKKSQLILALISKKLSRDACGSAEWRGRVDYKVAYPERHSLAVGVSTKSRDVQGASKTMQTKRTDADAVQADWVQSCPTAATAKAFTTVTNRRKQNRRCAAVFDKKRSIVSTYALSSNMMKRAEHQPHGEKFQRCEEDNGFNANKRQRRNQDANDSDEKSDAQNPSSVQYLFHVLATKDL
ncbi:hypothetical protein ACHAXS_007833 [Conticribra weissflogii]